MRVLVTRPEHAGHETARRLAAMGHEPVAFSLSRAVHDRVAPEQALRHHHGPLVISSAEAIRAVAPLLSDDAAPLSRPLFAVGDASAKAAGDAGFRDVRTADGEGESLADLVAEQTMTTADQILYLAGKPRSPRFENRLAAKGIRIIVCECYRMEAVAWPEAEIEQIFETQPPHAVLFYSAEAVRLFFQLPLPATAQLILKQARFLCLSKNVAVAVPEEYQRFCLVAERSNEGDLLALLPPETSKLRSPLSFQVITD